MTSDGELLRRYAESASEQAFGDLVNRHLNLVYSAALRQVNRDAHLAQDVSQSVFNDLARKAANLVNHTSLAGWLYTSTHYAAAKAVRTERRRQTNEQEAQVMHELLRESEPHPDWETFRPVLDAAMQTLGETDREAVLLRYFENQGYADIGEQIGLTENAARMRTERALEKLRNALSREGVNATAAFATTLSAHAVSAAPAGLAATITGGALVAGTTATGTATAIATATKTIAMTTLQKTLITVLVATAVGTGIYATLKPVRLREQNEALQKEQAALTNQMQELQRQRDEATNQLSALLAENQQLKSNQNAAEVLKLRGKVGTLQQSLNSVAASNQPSTGISKMMNDPVMKEYIHQAQLKMIRQRYGPLLSELKLSPEQSEQFVQLIGETWLKGTEMGSKATASDGEPAKMPETLKQEFASLDDQVKATLGVDGYARYKQFETEIPARATVKLLKDELGDNALTDEQSARLFQIVKAEPFEATHGVSGDLDKSFFGTQEQIDAHLQQVTDSNQHILQKAAEVLTPEQLTTMSILLSNNLIAQKAQGAALTQKH
jgi:RNA polymerase sigma factor (sigma-70 family)